MSEKRAWRDQLAGIRAFAETLKQPEADERDTTSIAGKFAEALGCLEDAACHLRDIDKQYLTLYPEDECEEPELWFWWRIEEAIKPLETIQKDLETVAQHVPEEAVKA